LIIILLLINLLIDNTIIIINEHDMYIAKSENRLYKIKNCCKKNITLRQESQAISIIGK